MVRFAARMLLLVGLMLVANQVLYTHLTRDSHGLLIRHAHPFHRGKAPLPSGRAHTPFELVVLAELEQWIRAEEPEPMLPFVRFMNSDWLPVCQRTLPAASLRIPGRSPPLG